MAISNGNASGPISGTEAADVIDGKNGEDVIDALGGDDVVEGGLKSDTVNGGAGDDVIYGKSANAADPANPTLSEIISSTDNGQIDGPNELNGDAGDDLIIGRERGDVIHGDNDDTGSIEFASKSKVNYEDVPETLQDFSVSASGPEAEDGANYSVGGENNEGIGVGGKTVDYLYKQSSQSNDANDTKDVEGGEILSLNVGTTASEGSVDLRNLDEGERVKITALRDGEEVGSVVYEGVDGDDKIQSYDVNSNGKLFDTVEIEALAGSDGPLDGSTSFNVKGADFTTVAVGDDTIVGGGGDDTMKGGYGDDLFIEASASNGNRNGNDDIDGGEGFDTVDYSGATIRGPGNQPGVMANLSEDEITVSADRSTDTISVEVDGTTYTIDDDQPGGQEVNMEETVDAGTVKIRDNGGETVDTLTSIEKVIGSDSRQDVMVGSEGREMFAGGDRADLLIGEGGDDTLKGEDGDDKLFGGDGEDRLLGGDGDDHMSGGADDDKATGGLGNDTFDGGEGVDTFKVGGSVTPTPNTNKDNLFIQLDDDGNGTAMIDRDGDGVAEEMDELIGVENVIGTKGNDEIRGGDQDNKFDGGKGDDFLRGDGGNDTGVGGVGDDTMDGGVGYDTFKVGGGFDTKDVGEDGDGVGGVMLDMSGMSLDVPAAKPGSAVGNAEVKIDRDGDGVFEETDIIRKVENVTTGNGNDTITGNDDNNVITTRKGDDVINAGAGDDTVKAGKGDDILDGGEGKDVLFAGKGNDILVFDSEDFTDASTKTRKYKTDGDMVEAEFQEDLVGKNDNKLAVEQINEKIYHGGKGYDVLKVEGDAEINMLGKGISGVEAIVATKDDTVQTVKASLDEIRRESDDADAAQDKGFDTFTFISGNDEGDSLDLFGNGWTLAGSKLGSKMGNAQATPTNTEDFLGAGEVAALDAAFGGNGDVSLQNGLAAVDGSKLNVFVFEKANGTFVTVWTDLTADDITLNGISVAPEMA